MDGKNNEIKIYPNPVVQQIITIQLSNMQKGNYQLLFYNNLGQIAYRKTINHDGGSVIRNISLPHNVIKGVYSIQLKTDKLVYSQLMIIQ